MEIVSIKYGESTLPESWVFQNGDVSKKYPIVFLIYLIRTDDKNILVDAGCETMPGFDMKNFIGPIKALENIGVNTTDITDVILTHEHHDHTECVKYFTNALVHIQRDEYEKAKVYIPDSFAVNLFDEEFYVNSNVKIIRVGGHSKGSCIVEVNMNDKTYIIAGDECYSRKCLIYKIPTGNTYCLQKSIGFVEKYSKEEYNVLLCHEENKLIQ